MEEERNEAKKELDLAEENYESSCKKNFETVVEKKK